MMAAAPIPLLFVGDGPRDKAMIPPLVEGILGTAVSCEFRAWKTLRISSGYRRKLLYAIRVAKDRDLAGLVATVDCDRAHPRSRLAELRAGREDDRAKNTPYPTAVGEAIPHAEAWLIDDQHAVRTILVLAEEVSVVSVSKSRDPKGDLDQLIVNCDRRIESAVVVFGEIARAVQSSRSQHAHETGFEAFAADVRTELGPLCASAPAA